MEMMYVRVLARRQTLPFLFYRFAIQFGTKFSREAGFGDLVLHILLTRFCFLSLLSRPMISGVTSYAQVKIALLKKDIRASQVAILHVSNTFPVPCLNLSLRATME